jgi:pyruvate/2-oxoglutarate dehydrogenase complex dihydrolipoamide acyltransferase (E2) component
MADTIIMPQLGETVAEGKILTWFKGVGDDIKVGDKLFEVETDKVTIEVEAIVAGKLTEIRVGNGSTSKVGTVVAVLNGDAVAAAAPARTADPRPEPPAAPVAALVPKPAQPLMPFEEVRTPTGKYGKAKIASDLRITPLARRLIAQRGLDLASITQQARAKSLRKIEEKDVAALAAAPVSPCHHAQHNPLAHSRTPRRELAQHPPCIPGHRRRFHRD